jgi:hypothetical protein
LLFNVTQPLFFGVGKGSFRSILLLFSCHQFALGLLPFPHCFFFSLTLFFGGSISNCLLSGLGFGFFSSRLFFSLALFFG